MNRVIGVQVDGKTMGTITVPHNATEAEASRAALMLPLVRRELGDGLSAVVAHYKVNCIIRLARMPSSSAGNPPSQPPLPFECRVSGANGSGGEN